MKDAKRILEHALRPYLKKVDEHRCFRALFAMLPPPLGQHVTLVYRKHRTLYIGVDSPAFKMEFNYKRNLIKELLTMVRAGTGLCREIEPDTIKVFVTEPLALEGIPEAAPGYPERAAGDFENESGDPAIHKRLETIRQMIIDAGNHP